MKVIHHLKARWLITASILAVVTGESIAWYITKALDVRFPAVTVAAVSVGLLVGGVSLLYDGRD